MIRYSYETIGDSYIKIDDLLKARAAFEMGISISPHPTTYYKLGLLAQDMSDHRTAIDYLEQAVKLGPDFAEAYYLLCKSYVSTGDRKKVLRYYKKLKKLDEDMALKFYKRTGFAIE